MSVAQHLLSNTKEYLGNMKSLLLDSAAGEAPFGFADVGALEAVPGWSYLHRSCDERDSNHIRGG